LVVCGLILDPFRQPPVKVSDSKTMSAAEREEAYAWIKEAALEIRVAVKSPRDVDELNPLVASLRGMEEAHGAMALKPRLSLIDGNALPFLPGEARAVIHGDEKSLAIAAASIVAKVTRDALMLAEHENYPQYGFDKHKGYATRAHLAVLAARGPSPIHRLSFKGVAPPPPPGPGGLF
jgi:ribonuclease HII